MKRFLIILIAITVGLTAGAQTKTVENRPYCDLRPFHFGVIVGTHFQDTEFENAGPTYRMLEDNTVVRDVITCEQDRWDAGFHVGVLGELRLDANFALRIAPTIYFGSRHFTFRNLAKNDIDGEPMVEHQDMKSAFVGCNFDIIFAAKRFNNHRPYIMVGFNPMINLTRRANDILQMNSFGSYAEVGLGCDLYLPYFKLRPELKFMYGLSNSLNKNHVNDLNDPAKLPYARSVRSATTQMFALTFYFE